MSLNVSPERVRAYYESHFGTKLRPNSEGWVTVRSPFRDDHCASFSINLRHGGWRDHGTNESGDIFAFSMRLTGCDLPTARTLVSGEAGCNQPQRAKPARPVPQAATRATVELLAKMKKLPENFLRRDMGLKDETSGVVIPYRLMDSAPAPRYQIRAFIEHIRTPNEKWCKWNSLPGDIVPYGLDRLGQAREIGYLLLVEGTSDCWTLWFHAFPALGIPGADMTDTLRHEHLEGIPKLFVVEETDRAGAHFVQRILARIKEIGWSGEVRIVSLSPYKDPSDLYCADPEEFKPVFHTALNDAKDAAKRTAQPASAGPWAAAEGMDTFLAGEEDEAEFLDDGKRFLARECITEIFSPRGLGKSLLALWLAVRLALRGLRVLYLDRDNPRRVVKGRLRSFGATRDTPNLKVIGREKCPPLTNAAAWASFPYSDYDVVIVDSFDSSAEGVGEQDSSKPSKAIASLLDVARHENGPAVMVLGNTVRSGKHSRCCGVIEDRADITYEVRDATDFHPNGSKPWAEELPPGGADSWASRSSRRKQRDKYRLAFVSSKFRVGEEPDPFILEIDTTTDPWQVTDVTDQVDAEGADARKQKTEERARKKEGAVAALVAEISRRAKVGEAAMKKRQDAEPFLTGKGLKRQEARNVLSDRDGQDWSLRPNPTDKRETYVLPLGKNEVDGHDSTTTDTPNPQGSNDANRGRPHPEPTATFDTHEDRETRGLEEPQNVAEPPLFTPPAKRESELTDEEVI